MDGREGGLSFSRNKHLNLKVSFPLHPQYFVLSVLLLPLIVWEETCPNLSLGLILVLTLGQSP